MKFIACNFTTKNRRGLSSVVGALLFVVLMVATFSVLGIALNTQTDIVSTARDVSEKDLKKLKEDFVINSVIQNPGDVLQINATNKGQNAAEMFTLIITNSSDIAEGFPTQVYEIPSDTSFLAPNVAKSTDIVKTLGLTMANADPSEKDTYAFKIISSLGTIRNLSIECDEIGLCGQSIGSGGSSGLAVQLFTDGPNGVNTKTSTVIMFVSNIGDVPLEDVYPKRVCPTYGNFFPNVTNAPPVIPGLEAFEPCDLTPLVDPLCGSGPTGSGGNNDGNGICLQPGQTALFKFDGVVAGDIGDVFLFCNEVSGQEYDDTNAPDSNTDCDALTVIDPNDCGGCGPGDDGDELVLSDELFGRPRLFMMFPNLMGDSKEDRGIWSLNIANPTDQSIFINKAIIIAYSPKTGGDYEVFKAQCENDPITVPEVPIAIAPTTDNWSCPETNQLMWQDLGNPQEILPRSVFPFMVKVAPGTIGGSTPEPSNMLIQPVVFSTLGQFGKSGYAASFFLTPAGIANVFLTRNLESTADADIIAEMRGIASGSTVTFNATLADMDTGSPDPNTWEINDDARLIINVHREWTEVTIITANSPGWEDLTVVEFSDGSSQVSGKLTTAITGPNDAKTIQFTAKAPTVTTTKLQVMYILADGTMTDNGTPPQTFTVGPLSEIVLQICPGNPVAMCPPAT